MSSNKGFWSRMAYYANPLTMFRKNDTKNVNLKMMHGMNRISMLVFLVCLVIMLFKFVL